MLFIPIALCVLTTSALGGVNFRKYDESVKELAALEKAGQIRFGALKAAALAHQLMDQTGQAGVIASVERTFLEKKKEVVTEETSLAASFKLFFGLVGGSAQASWDTAKLLTTNPEEVATYSSIKARDFLRLQKTLMKYLLKNETELFFAKIFAAKAVELTSKLPVEEVSAVYGYVMKSAQLVSAVSFSGFQTVTNCLQIDYADRASGWGIRLKGLVSVRVGQQSTQIAHQETTCSQEQRESRAEELALNSADLMIADHILKEQNQILGLKLVRESSAPMYPTWGSPNIEN